MRRIVPVVIAALFVMVPAGPGHGQESHGPEDRVHIEGLGSLSFPSSGDPEAREPFLRGVLLLHSFEYEDAAEAFRRAQERDSDFALAYWGEAMTHTHPLWNQQDREAALEALRRYAPTAEARAARAPTARERAYLEAVDVLYGEGAKAARDTAYSRAMERLVQDYPDDFEARAFYALSLLGLSQAEREVPTYMRAGAIALDLFEENPGHPGAAHYAIHSFDDPAHAPLGLEAARAYAAIAPDAAHAQHMTSHIFLALGMWDDVVDANERASAVSDRVLAERGVPPGTCGHYYEWLLYGYQQQGRYGDAAEILDGCYQGWRSAGAAQSARRGWAGSYVYMRALHLADSRDAAGRFAEARIDEADLGSTDRMIGAWGTGFAAVHRGDVDEARGSLQTLEALAGRAEGYRGGYAPIWIGTLRSLILAGEGRMEEALSEAREAADHEAGLPVDFGPPISFKPPRELEGELLLEMGRADEALAAFRLALERTPRRARTLVGFARAAEAAGETRLAAEAYGTLVEVLDDGADLPELEEARGFLERGPEG